MPQPGRRAEQAGRAACLSDSDREPGPPPGLRAASESCTGTAPEPVRLTRASDSVTVADVSHGPSQP